MRLYFLLLPRAFDISRGIFSIHLSLTICHYKGNWTSFKHTRARSVFNFQSECWRGIVGNSLLLLEL